MIILPVIFCITWQNNNNNNNQDELERTDNRDTPRLKFSSAFGKRSNFIKVFQRMGQRVTSGRSKSPSWSPIKRRAATLFDFLSPTLVFEGSRRLRYPKEFQLPFKSSSVDVWWKTKRTGDTTASNFNQRSDQNYKNLDSYSPFDDESWFDSSEPFPIGDEISSKGDADEVVRELIPLPYLMNNIKHIKKYGTSSGF